MKTDFLIYAGVPALAIWIEQLKGKYQKLYTGDEQIDYFKVIEEKIDKEGLYHFTDSTALSKIIESKKMKTSKGIFKNHTTDGNRVYMFGGMPEFDYYRKNLDDDTNPFIKGRKNDLMSRDANMVYTAIHFDKDEEDVDRLSARVEDGIVTYKGEMDISQKIKDGKVAISYVVMEHNENGDFILTEKERQVVNESISKEEIDKKIEEISKKYIPSEELYKSVQKNRKNILLEWCRMMKIESQIAMNIGTKNLVEIVKQRLEGKLKKYEDKTNKDDKLNLKSQVYTEEELSKNISDKKYKKSVGIDDRII